MAGDHPNPSNSIPTHPIPDNTLSHFGRFSTLEPGAIQPQGWLKQWAQINADGWLLSCARSRQPGVYDKFWNRNPSAAIQFSENNETLTLCDYTAYFADGLVHYASLCPDSELACVEVVPWLERLLASQDADGYLGAFAPGGRWQHWLEVFSQALTIEALLFRYSCTGDPTLLECCQRAALQQMQVWYQPPKDFNPGIFSSHGTIVVRVLAKLYALTGDMAYRHFAENVLKKYGLVKTMLQPGDALFGQHNSVGSEHTGLPVMLYETTGDPTLLEASQAGWEMMVQHHLSVDGSPHGNEAMWFKGPLHNCEHCGAVDWFLTSNALARVTGEVKYADAAERVMLNAYPAAKTPDGMAVAYMHTPNQLFATEWSQPHAWTSPDWCASRQHYHSAHEPLCCNVNGPRGIPHFVESMVMRAGAGLAVVYYGPCQVQTILPGSGAVSLQIETGYPFEDVVAITVTPQRPSVFPLLLRVPAWCGAAVVTLNGADCLEPAVPGSYLRLERAWQPGDVISLHFEYPLRLEKWERSEFGLRAAGAAVLRGPLTFALPLQEDWQPFKPPAQGPGKDVVAYRVMLAEGAPWSYALALDPQHPDANLALVHLSTPVGSRPWEHPPLGLKARARRVLNWYLEGDPEHPRTPLLPFNPVRMADNEEEVTLVPFGFTHLRLSYLPFYG
jgi:hypothetical protein